ncbi:MAG TPA: hypothetical protein VLL08_21950 [Kineosporiaceae bacterium]|nr:hypothetical protein [Kineosporiaceae bacterium]
MTTACVQQLSRFVRMVSATCGVAGMGERDRVKPFQQGFARGLGRLS